MNKKVYITTIPETQNYKFIKSFIEAGADGIRLIAKGIDEKEINTIINNIYKWKVELNNKDFKVIIDLPGRKPRVGSDFHELKLVRGDKLVLIDSDNVREQPDSYRSIKTIGLFEFYQYLKLGDRIIIADGLIELAITKIDESTIHTECLLSDIVLTPNRSINLIDSNVDYGSLSNKDMEVLNALRNSSFDFDIAISMVTKSETIKSVKNIVGNKRIIAKIETKKGIDARFEIAKNADAIMIARGDLSIECGIQGVGYYDDIIVEAANHYNKPLILATGLLDSIKFINKPTISESVDIWQHFKKGIGEFLISGGIAIEKPIKAINQLKYLLTEMELFIK